MHLDEERLQRQLHGELDPQGREAITRHLATCAECRRRMVEAEREEAWLAGLFRSLDHPAPTPDLQALTAGTPRGRFGAGRWAAAVLLLITLAGALQATPGSPLTGWFTTVARWLTGQDRAPLPSPPAPPETAAAGIAVTPGPRFVIRFAGPQRGSVTVSLTTGSDIVLRAVGGQATFTSEADRLVVENQAALADYQVELPATAPWVEIQAGDRRLLLKQGNRMVSDLGADTTGRITIQLTP